MHKLIRDSRRLIRKYTPQILTGFSIVGTVATAAVASICTAKSLKRLEEEEQDRAFFFETEGDDRPWDTAEKVKTVWPYYIPVVAVCGATIVCIVITDRTNAKRQASLASAYMMLSTAFNEYRQTANQVYGEDADVNIQSTLVEKRIGAIGELPDGCVWFCESITNSFFPFSLAEFYDAKCLLNKKMMENGEAALNEFFELINVPSHDYGEEIGWETWALMDMNGSGYIELDLTPSTMDDGTEYYLVTYPYAPYAFNYPYEGELPFK